MAIKIGTAAGESIDGTAVSDFLVGGYGNDTIGGGAGHDLILGGFGDDSITLGTAHASVYGGAGTDTLNLAAGAWRISPPGLGNFGFLIDLATGQGISINSVEQVRIGTRLITLATGSDLDETINGTGHADYIRGLDGKDRISTGNGADWVSSGSGADTVATGAGNDTIDDGGTAGGFEFLPAPVKNNFNLGTGNDIARLNVIGDFASGAPTETFTIDGGAGKDVVFLEGLISQRASVNASGDIVTSGFLPGNPSLFADLKGVEQVVDVLFNNVWTINGNIIKNARPILNIGAAPLSGSVLSEDLRGNAQANTLIGNGGYDRFFGGAGNDTVVFSGRAELFNVGVFLDPITTQNAVQGVVLNSDDVGRPASFVARDIEFLKFENGPGANDDATYRFKVVTNTAIASAFSAGNDFVVIDPGAAQIATIQASAGDDIIFGRGKINGINAGTGDDRVTWATGGGTFKLTGGDGDDNFNISATFDAAPNGAVTLDGGAGDDVLSAFGETLSVKMSGGAGDDFLNINAGGMADGGAGNDQFGVSYFAFGKGVNATITGGAGDDVVTVQGFLTDYMISDVAGGLRFTSKASGSSFVASGMEAVNSDEAAVLFDDLLDAKISNLGATPNTLNGVAGMDVANGGAGTDRLKGNGGADILAGDAANDTLQGGAGDDNLAGGAGNDNIKGDAGNDIVIGGAGNDVMAGGAGIDQFWFDFLTGVQGNPVHTGADRVVDFQRTSGDVIVIRTADPMLNSFEDAMAHATQVGGNTVIDFGGGDKLTISGIKTTLAADDFLFLT